MSESRVRRFRLGSRRLRIVVGLVTVTLLIMSVPGVSYARALAAPGYAGWQVRTVEWIREHGGASVINAAENWWYSQKAPASFHGAGPLSNQVPRPGDANASRRTDQPPPLPVNTGPGAQVGEGIWRADPRTVNGRPVLYTAFFRPDPVYSSAVAGIAWMPRAELSTTLITGTRLPGGPGAPDGHAVPASARSSVVAAFNSGFKLGDSEGGFYDAGTTSKPLVDGGASLVFHQGGTMSIGVWGKDVTLTPDVVAVRQNLHLIVDNGAVVPGLAHNAGNAWGTPGQQNQFTWRSGIGVDANGNLIYIAAQQFNLPMLASALASAGVVRGMQLDIHKGQVTFNVFRQTSPGGQAVTASKLLPEMTEPASRYLKPDQRDFIAVFARPSPL